MIIRKTIYNNSIKQVRFDEKSLDEMSDHLIGKRLSVYRENIYDADGDGKVTLKDFNAISADAVIIGLQSNLLDLLFL